MAVGSRPEWPFEQPLLFADWQVVQAAVPHSHESIVPKLPVLVAVGPKPVAAVVVPLVRVPVRLEGINTSADVWLPGRKCMCLEAA